MRISVYYMYSWKATAILDYRSFMQICWSCFFLHRVNKRKQTIELGLPVLTNPNPKDELCTGSEAENVNETNQTNGSIKSHNIKLELLTYMC